MYGVIVCTKCRLHAQVIEVGISRTVQCQRCGARLELRKLQLLATYDNYDQVVTARTLIQAKIQTNDRINLINVNTFQYNKPENNNSVAGIYFSAPDNSRKIRSRDPSKIILEYISAQGELSIEEVEEKCVALDIDKNVIESIISRLLETGELYIPAKGRIKKV